MHSAVWKDPTVLFTVFVVKAPLVFHVLEHGAQVLLTAAINHFLSPTMIASYVYLYIVVKIAHMGNPVKLSPRDNRVALWYLMNGVYYNLFFDVVAGQFQANGLLTDQYKIVEPRYFFGPYDVRGQSVFWTSMCELFFQSPFCILAYYAYVQGKPWRRPLEIIIACLHMAGVWWFYVPEAYAGFPHLGGWPTAEECFSFHRLFYFWFAFWILGGTWIVVPGTLARTAFNEITSIIAKHDGEKSR